MFITSKARRSPPLVALILILAAHTVSAQSLSGLLSSGNTSAAATSPSAADRLGRATPRSSVYNFLEACHQDRFVLAAEYLDLRRLPTNQRVTEGPELARQLADVLDRDPKFELARLSDSPEGNTTDGLASDRDTLVNLEVNGSTVTLEMQRITQQGLSVWLVSADSVARLPELDSLTGESEIEKKLPAVLVETKLLGTALWVWIALVGLGLVISLLSRLLSRLFLAVLKPLARRYAKWLHAYRLEAFVEPLRLLLSVVVFAR
jgi:MscS family membrane protein